MVALGIGYECTTVVIGRVRWPRNFQPILKQVQDEERYRAEFLYLAYEVFNPAE
jgi:hypothetical protein